MNRQRTADLEIGCIAMNKTIQYYDNNAKEFCSETFLADMSQCWNRFLNYLPSNAWILDAGCGSGRDSKAFIESGYQVEAFDASREICKIASANIGQEVMCMRFDELTYEMQFDGIWASASLLHVSKQDLPVVMEKLYVALKPQGILYASFKYGEGEMIRGERSFTDFAEVSVKELLEDAGFVVLECFVTSDVREGRSDEKWVNVIGRKG